MSERDSRPFNKRACGFLIAGAFILLVIVVAALKETPPPVAVTDAVSPLPPRRVDLIPPVFDAQSYYQTIIDNNLFRPLGWTPPRPKEPYRLIGTIHPTDDRTPPKSILQSTSKSLYCISSANEM